MFLANRNLLLSSKGQNQRIGWILVYGVALASSYGRDYDI